MMQSVEIHNLKRAMACYLYEIINNCEKCPFGYSYKDMTGDKPTWKCDDDKLIKDALYLLDE